MKYTKIIFVLMSLFLMFFVYQQSLLALQELQIDDEVIIHAEGPEKIFTGVPFQLAFYLSDVELFTGYELKLNYDESIFDLVDIRISHDHNGVVYNISQEGKIFVNYSDIANVQSGDIFLFELELTLEKPMKQGALLPVSLNNYYTHSIVFFDEELKVTNNLVADFYSTTIGMLGDVNQDGLVSIIDVATIQAYLAGIIDITNIQKLHADIDLDGQINLIDAAMIQMYLARLLQTPFLPHSFTEDLCINRADEGVVYYFDQDFKDVIELRVWLDDEDYFNALKAAFEDENPDIVLNFVKVPSTDVRRRLELFGSSPQAADVFIFPHDHIGPALRSGLLAEIEGAQAADIRARMINSAIHIASPCLDVHTNAIIECVDPNDTGTLFAAPLVGETVAFFYNKDLLHEYTGSSTPPASFEELLAMVSDFTSLGNNPIIGLDVRNPHEMHFIATSFGFELFGPEGLDPNQPNLASNEMIAALTWFHETLRPALGDGSLVAGDLSGDANRTLFEEGRIPFIIDGPWSIARYLNADVNFGITQIPTINGVQPTSFSGVQFAGVNSQSRNPDAAFRLLEFMTSDEGLAILYEQKNILPALKDISSVEGLSENVFMIGFSSQLNYSQPMPIIPQMGFFWSNAGSMYSQAWNGTRTPRNAAIIANNGYVSQSGYGESMPLD